MSKEIYERCAQICESMIVVGRAWTEEQAIVADALFAAAREIRCIASVPDLGTRSVPGQPEASKCDTEICRCGAWRDDRQCLSQPEARSGECPDKATCAECADGPEAPSLGHPGADEVFRSLQARRAASQPEAPKGPAAEVPTYAIQMKRDLAAANAKIAALEAKLEASVSEWCAANARADAAERSNAEAGEMTKALLESQANLARERDEALSHLKGGVRLRECISRKWAVERERDQLAARVKELEAELDETESEGGAALDAANARADAAERLLENAVVECERQVTKLAQAVHAHERDVVRWEKALAERDQLAQKLEKCFELSDSASEAYLELRDERDQLAARVTELEQDREGIIEDLGSNQLTPEEREVLEALGIVHVFNLETWVKLGPAHDEYSIAKAELANRAAKARVASAATERCEPKANS